MYSLPFPKIEPANGHPARLLPLTHPRRSSRERGSRRGTQGSYVNSHARSSFGSSPLSASRSAPSGDNPSAVLPKSIPKSQYTSSGSSASPSSAGPSSACRNPKLSSPASSRCFLGGRRGSAALREGPGLSRGLIFRGGSWRCGSDDCCGGCCVLGLAGARECCPG